MTLTSNFRRVLCCLLVLVVVFITTVRPLTVQAVSPGMGALAGFVGIAPEVAIPAILALLGVGLAIVAGNAIYEWIEDAISNRFVEVEDKTVVPAYDYEGRLYVDKAIVEATAEAVDSYYATTYSDAWNMGQKYKYMYTFTLSDPTKKFVCWTDGTPYVDDTFEHFLDEVILVPVPALVYRYTNREFVSEYTSASSVSGVPDGYINFSFSDVTIEDITRTEIAAVADPSPNYAPGITVTTPENETLSTVPIANAADTEYVETNTQVQVQVGSDAGSTPGTDAADLSGILAWLQAIWAAIKALASNITTPIVNAISSITSWLSDIWDAIKSLASDITTPIVSWLHRVFDILEIISEFLSIETASWFSSVWGVLQSLVTDITTPISEALDVVKSRLQSITAHIAGGVSGPIVGTYQLVNKLVKFFTDTATVASPSEALHFSALFDLFPFNIPYGIYQAISFWEASAAPPVITIPLPTVSGGSVDLYEYEIDFSEIPGMDTIAAVIRGGELILFCIGLLLITRKVTKW